MQKSYLILYTFHHLKQRVKTSKITIFMIFVTILTKIHVLEILYSDLCIPNPNFEDWAQKLSLCFYVYIHVIRIIGKSWLKYCVITGGLLHELSNEGARQQFELFLEDLILPQMVQAAQVSVKSVFMFPVCAKYYLWSHRGRNRIVVGFTATCAINSNPVHGEVYSI